MSTLMSIVPMVGATLIDWSGVKFDEITSEITGAVPFVLPVVFTVLAVRKGISFVLGCVRGA